MSVIKQGDPTTLNRLYGRSSSHKLRKGQAELVDTLLPAVSVPADGEINSELLFGDDRPLHLEIGFGGGEHLAYRADLLPDHGFIGCEPFLDGRAVLSLGAFDYGPFWNPMVLRWPPLSGERIIPRWVWDAIPPHKLDGYTIEVMINEVVCEGRMPFSARVMDGVTHRTKRDKFGRAEGYRRTWRMFWQLWGLWGVCRKRTYWFYLRGLTVER